MKHEKMIEALDADKAGDWNKAHTLAQAEDSESGYWVHAYLHRKEGDASNAAYWYSRADKPVPEDSLEAEWERLYLAFS